MPLYEHVFLARQDVSSQQVETLVEQFKGIITQGGGTVGKVEPWGLKSISYRIKKNRKAHYTLLNLDAPPAAVAEMERQMGLNEDIIRFITIRVETHETEPSAMMQKRDRNDRDDRPGGFGGGGFGGGRSFGGGGGFGGGGFRGGRDRDGGGGGGGGYRGDRDRGPRADAPRSDDAGGSVE